ncbi:SMP-30/gluconolactonase/LRE family protein [Nocardia sp. NPDC127579]|uniref:SMP-30/gluconolactonase/LRE family protein n=1 Tax=Nocardia sp. NPDC127579 TaxID=3345402 RepID=UPI003640DC6A
MKTIDKVASALAVAAFGVLTTVTAPAAGAAPVCPGSGQPTVQVATVPGASLEGFTVDPLGRAFTTDVLSGRVLRIDAPGAAAVPIATVPSGGAGALAWTPDGGLLVGYGADARVALGDSLRHAGVVRVDPDTGAVTPFAAGLSAANGMDVGSDGIVYATNDFGNLIGRVNPDGVVQPDWANLPSANGAVLGSDDRYLYVSRTFVNPGVSRIPTDRPDAPQSLLELGGATPDGLTLDSMDRPVVPLNTTGEIIRVDGPGVACRLGVSGALTSVVAYGRGVDGFGAGRLFAATFTGAIFEIPGGFDPNARTAAP